MRKKYIFKTGALLIGIFMAMLIFRVKNYKIITEAVDKFNYQRNVSYRLLLDIPEIGLTKPLYKINDPNNDVNLNLQVMKESTFPWENSYSNIIITGHSGFGYKAYFNNLKDLKLGDKINIVHNNLKYIYKLDNISEIKKDGNYSYGINVNDNLITLITCNILNYNRQTVYIGKLYKKRSSL